jgi:hypothetical protein
MVLSSPDGDREHRELTRRLVHAYCDTQQDWMAAVDGTIGRRLPTVAARSPLTVDQASGAVVVGRDWRPGMLGYEFAHDVVAALRSAGTFPDGEPIGDGQLEGWLTGLDLVAASGEFFWSVNDYAVVCHKTIR